ncbi:hypothetical protein Z043_116740 [Scleropages formosus]|uniref:Uncharacterized protein n=1 Tax=Scleropages formosus TaxID=113540 RepID=A0A0P7UB72_SCLFO|nr:hypothetical protein Z043_116740 [Scleropages formosus]
MEAAAAQAAAVKGLTSIGGARSLSCTDLINNFYQPVARDICGGWMRVGEGALGLGYGVEGGGRGRGGSLVAGRKGKGFRSRFTNTRQEHTSRLGAIAMIIRTLRGNIYISLFVRQHRRFIAW